MRLLTPISLLLPLAFLFFSGCTGYQRGSLPDAHTASVYLKPVQNEAYLSGIAPLFQSELRQQILDSRTLILADKPEDADMEAYVRLVDYNEEPIGYLETDTGQPISARLSLSALITLSETDSEGDYLLEDSRVSIDTAVYSSPSTAFPNPVDQSKPAMARNLAQKVVLQLELQRP
ncbi:MAG: LPS assembly lipoprotein LptE [Puniceicoccales bacterium]